MTIENDGMDMSVTDWLVKAKQKNPPQQQIIQLKLKVRLNEWSETNAKEWDPKLKDLDVPKMLYTGFFL